MSSELSNLIEELEDLLDAHAEYDGTIDPGNLEARRIYEDITNTLEQAHRLIQKAVRTQPAAAEAVEEIEELLGDTSEAFAELGAMM